MLEKIAYVLFYAVMTLVAVTCLSQLATLTAFHDANWFSAWGSWVSGVGTFAAVGVALYISNRDHRTRKAERYEESRFKRHLAAYKLLLFTQEFKARLENIHIGVGLDEATWIMLRTVESTVPFLRMDRKVSEIPDVSQLGILMEKAFTLEQEADALNMILENGASYFQLSGRTTMFDNLKPPLEAGHARAVRLEASLEHVLHMLRVEVLFETLPE